MADSKDEILTKLNEIKASIDTGFVGVNAKLDDIRNDIHVISEAHLSPTEKKRILTGSSPNWPRAVDPLETLKEG